MASNQISMASDQLLLSSDLLNPVAFSLLCPIAFFAYGSLKSMLPLLRSVALFPKVHAPSPSHGHLFPRAHAPSLLIGRLFPLAPSHSPRRPFPHRFIRLPLFQLHASFFRLTTVSTPCPRFLLTTVSTPGFLRSSLHQTLPQSLLSLVSPPLPS